MTALSPALNPARPDLRSWLAALTGRGVAVFASDSEGIPRAADSTDDTDDVRLARHGDEQAFERIVRRHQQEVARRLRRFARNAVVLEELVQETFVQAYFALGSYRGDAPLIHWLHRIAVRVGYRFWRENRARPTHAPLDAQSLASPSPRATVQLDAVLDRLSPRDRLVITLLHLEDRSVQETSALTGWSRTMVKVQAFRARRKLRKLMTDLHPGERP